MEGSKIQVFFEEFLKQVVVLTRIPLKGYVAGGGEMENHFECLWDLFRSIPSLEIDNTLSIR